MTVHRARPTPSSGLAILLDRRPDLADPDPVTPIVAANQLDVAAV